MPKPVFVEKLLARLEKVDKKALRSYVVGLRDEKEFSQNILAELPVGIFIAGNNLKVRWANETAAHLLGFRAPLEKEMPLAQAVTDPEWYRWLENILLEGKSVYNEEHEILFPREHQLIVHVKPLEVGHEPVRYFLICLVDITGMGSREKEKNVLGRIQSLLRLSKGIAHELGNPLNSIAIHLKLLGKMCESVSSKEKKKIESALEVLTQETGRLDRIVKNFLKATRQIPPQFKVGNIHEILEEALRFFGPEMKQYKIKLKTEFAPSMPPFLFDRDKMHQVFLNLIKNAVEAMPNGGELKVKTAVWQKVCSIAFQDNGFGISEDDMPHIFEDYYTTKEEGSGLGLAIVYNIVREHGGRIDVKSAPRKGTLMILYMPIRTHKLQIPEQTL